MKTLIFVLLFIPMLANAQFSNHDCGDFKQSMTQTDWADYDTIDYNPNADNTWVYSKIKTDKGTNLTLVFKLCPSNTWNEWQLRVSDVGVIQKKTWEYNTWYEKSIHPYDAKVKELKDRNE